MAMQNAQALRNDYYTDVYFKGHYNKAAQIYLEEHGLAPVMEEGDLELLADPAAISDFLALIITPVNVQNGVRRAVRKFPGAV